MKNKIQIIILSCIFSVFGYAKTDVNYIQKVSDLDCLINAVKKYSKNKQEGIREALLAANYTKIRQEIAGLEEILKSDKFQCVVNRLYFPRDTLLEFIRKEELNILQHKMLLEETQRVTKLLELRTLFTNNYAYFDEKKEIFNAEWHKAVHSINDVDYNDAKCIKRILSVLY